MGASNLFEALAKAAIAAYGRLDIAINSAGRSVMSLISDLGREQLEFAARVNFFGPTFLIKYMVEVISANGSIVFISSMSTSHPIVPHAAYAGAKSAADRVVRYAAIEYGPRISGSIRSCLARSIPTWPGKPSPIPHSSRHSTAKSRSTASASRQISPIPCSGGPARPV